MKRLIILLFASLVTVGLLIACSNPSAQPMDGNGNGNGDGNGMTTPTDPPDPPAPANLDLTLEGWTDRSDTADAGTFTWTLEVDDAGVGGIDTKLELEFSDGATDLAVEAGADTADGTTAAVCTGLENVDIEVSGLTISFSGELGAACVLIAGFDRDADGDTPDVPTDDGDELEFEITLAAAPDTTPVDADDAENQEIDVTGTVTVTGGGENDEGSESFNISGTVTYMTPTITTQKAN